ncbi:MAG: hypothetical protein IKO49_00165 [Bacilli bacterium]|nr:hypothetical protein [Bacilli bacterium]
MFNKKNKNNLLGGLDQNPFLKQIIFFGFYFLFFVVIIIFLRISFKSISTKEVSIRKTGYGYDYKLDRIMNENYHFKFKENYDGVETIYEGDLLGDEISLFKSGTQAMEYYIKKDKAYLKDGNLFTWNETTNPMIFYDFVIPSNLNKIIKRAKYVSKTDYIDSKKKTFTYSIANEKIIDILGLEKRENDVLDNTIVVSILDNGKIDSINLDLTNYYKYSNETLKNYNLTFSYSKFDQIEEIANPIN